MTAIFFGLLLLADFAAVVFQTNSPPLPMFFDARIMVYPVILAYGALALPFPGALALAFCNGLFWDALTVQILNPAAMTGKAPLVEIPLGWSIMVYGVLAVLVHGLRPLFLRGRWEVHCLASGFCTAAILLGEYSMITFRRGGLVFPQELWARILLPGFFAMLIAVVVYLVFNSVAGLIGYEVRAPEERTRAKH